MIGEKIYFYIYNYIKIENDKAGLPVKLRWEVMPEIAAMPAFRRSIIKKSSHNHDSG